MRYGHIFFDLDGTLTDSGPGVINGFVYALEALGLTVEREKLVDLVGPPLEDSFKSRFGLNEADARRGVKMYRDYYQNRGVFEGTVYAGIPSLLAALRDAGVELVLATSKPEAFTAILMKHFDLAKYFAFMAGADLTGRRSRKADVLRYAMENSALGDARARVMVGDTHYDVEGAHAVGLPCIGVGYGYGGEESLRSAGAEYIAPTVADLRGLLFA